MTAQQIALSWHQAIQDYDRGVFGIDQLSRTVRDLWALSDDLGIRDEVNTAYDALRGP